MSESQGRNSQEIKCKESETIDGHRVEGGDFKEVRQPE